MKSWLIAVVRLLAGLALLIVGMYWAGNLLPGSDEFGVGGFDSRGSLPLFFLAVAAIGAMAGLVARRYLLIPALLSFWLLWAVFIGLDQLSEIKRGSETYLDGVLERALQIVVSSTWLVAGMVVGGWLSRRIEQRLARPE